MSTLSGVSPSTEAATIWSTVCICDPVQTVALSSSARMVTSSGSIGAWARYGKR